MTMSGSDNRGKNLSYRIVLVIIIMLQFVAALYFSTRKTGFHYDEYYSYYSSNVTAGLVPTDNEWMDTGEISDEFMVLPGEGFNYSTVKLMQTYDVHPPFYYYILHTVCSLTPGVFSKWQGLAVNLLFYVLCLPLLAGICGETLSHKLCRPNKAGSLSEYSDNSRKGTPDLCQLLTIFSILLFGFSPAILSGVMFIRMYVLLTFLCLLTVYVNLKIMRYADAYRADTEKGLQTESAGKKNKRRQILFALGLFALTLVGTLTHYYYIVFLFFTAAYMTLYLFIRKSEVPVADDGDRSAQGRGKVSYSIDLKNAACYAAPILMGLVAAVVYYPSMLSHIFRGYRGTEAAGAFFDMGNLRERAGLFVGMLDDYLLPGMFYLLVLYALIMYITYRYAGKRPRSTNHQVSFIATVTAGYFLVVLKTALMNAEEAVRYEMPVYGLIIILIVYAVLKLIFFGAGSSESAEEEHITYPSRGYGSFRFKTVMFCALLAIALLLQLRGLFSGKVLFLYEDDKASYDWAAEHKDDTIVYIYNPDNQWMIWDDAAELMEYERIFFISADNEDAVTDTAITGANSIYVYAVRTDEAADRIERLLSDNANVTNSAVIRELRYADLYELY